MFRLHTSLIYPAMGLASACFALNGGTSPDAIVVPVLSILLIAISAYMLNDIFDLGVDRVSSPDRPLPSGMLSVREVLVVVFACLAGGAFLASLGSPFSFSVALILIFLVFAYSAPPLRFRRFLVAPYLTIASFACLSFLMGSGFVAGQPQTRLILGSLLVFSYATGSCMVKEFKDIEGDSRDGVQSLPVYLGLDRAVAVTLPIYLAVCLLVLPFFYLFDLGPLFLVSFAAVFLAKVKTSYDLLQDPSDMARRTRILGVEVVSTILLFLAAAASALLHL